MPKKNIPESLLINWCFVSFGYDEEGEDSIDPKMVSSTRRKTVYYADRGELAHHLVIAHASPLDPKHIEEIVQLVLARKLKLALLFHSSHLNEIDDIIHKWTGSNLTLSKRGLSDFGLDENDLIEEIASCALNKLRPNIDKIYELEINRQKEHKRKLQSKEGKMTQIPKRLPVGTKVVTVGSFAYNIIFMGDEFPQPGKRTEADEQEGKPGGKALVQAIAVARLRGIATAIAYVGNDMYGEEIIRRLQLENVNVDHIFRLEGYPTDIVLVLLDEGNEPRYIGYAGAAYHITSEFISQARQKFEKADAVTSTFGIDLEAVHTAFELGKEQNAVTILRGGPPTENASESPLREILQLTDFLVAKEWEIRKIWNDQDSSLEDLADKVLQSGPRNVCITDAVTKGYFKNSDGTAYYLCGFPMRIVDASGAPDAFCAGLAITLGGKGVSVEEALCFAFAVSSCSAQHRGVIDPLPGPYEVKSFLREYPDHQILSEQKCAE